MSGRPWVSGGATHPDPQARQTTVLTRDGRTLGVAEYGPVSGSPIVSIHGTPGCRFGGPPPDQPELYERLGARVVSFDRPGYGLSDRRPGRQVASAAEDVEAIADALALDRFAVTGGSGGGPHALAVAALLADRVTRVGCVVGVAPLGSPGLPEAEWLAGMTQGNVDEFTWAMQGEDVLRPNLERLAADDLARVAVDPTNPLGDTYQMSQADQEILARPAYAVRMQRLIQEAYRQGVDGWLDDDLVFTRSWGFDVSSLSVPAMVWYGSDDTLVPPAHGRWLAENIPGARVVTMDGGHLELVNRAEELVRWLLEGAVPEDARTP